MSKNNDEIFNTLETLEEYAHAAPGKALMVVKAVIEMDPLKPRASNLKGFGKLYGKSHEDLLKQCSKILEKVRYLETKKVVELLEVLNKNPDTAVKSKVKETFKRLAQYNLFALKQIGYKPQMQILGQIERWSNKRLLENSELVFIASEELLSPTYEGQSMTDYQTLTIHSGPLKVTDELKFIRKKVIAILKKIYFLSNDLHFRIKILQTLQHAAETPLNHLHDQDLTKMVLGNTDELIEFYLRILPSADNELIQDIEEQKVWFTRRFKDTPPQKLSELDEAIKSNEAYGMFRVFVGHDGRLDPDYDFERDRTTRAQRIEEFVDDISDENIDEWKHKILSVLKNHSVSEPGGYGYFETFLFKVGSNKPDIAVKLISQNEKELAPFLLNLVSGIWSSRPTEAKKLISTWIKQGKYLPSLSFVFVLAEDFDFELFQRILKKAKTKNDLHALNNLFRSALQFYPQYKMVKPFLLEMIQELTKKENFRWVDNLWYKSELILESITKKDWEILLDSLLLLPEIDFQAERILEVLVNKDPGRVIRFFHDRVKIKSEKRYEVDDRYDGVPFNLYKLSDALRPHAEIIVPLILKWYQEGGKKHNWLFKWEASHLFEEIFPTLDPTLENALIDLARKGTKQSREIIFSVLGKYEGGSFLWSIVRTLVNQYANTKEYEEVVGHLFGYLSQTGIVSGEDGFVRAYQAKKKEIQRLKRSSDVNLKKFAKEYEDYLNRRISDEKKRTSEEIELMKRGIR